MIGADAPDAVTEGGVTATPVVLSAEAAPELAARYLGDAQSAVYLIRPDQHVAARWDRFDDTALRAALRRASGQEDRHG